MCQEPLATTSVITLSLSICKKLIGNKPLISILSFLPLPLPLELWGPHPEAIELAGKRQATAH
jgi:hypothetical protein